LPPEKTIEPGEIGVDYFMSKQPGMFRDMPLTLVLDICYRTNVKLNLTRDQKSYLFSTDQELLRPEFH
jgi:hypothetical protein